MTTSSPSQQAEQQYRKIAADHIRELSSVSEKIPSVLKHAALGISALTNSPLIPSSSPTPIDSTHLRKQMLQSAAQNAMRLIDQIDATIHAQVNALADLYIIPSTSKEAKEETTHGSGPQAKKDPQAAVTNNGLGNLDIGYLNSRAGSMQEAMDKELLARVNGILEELAGGVKAEEREDESMVDG
ncbi:hypothetical protein GQ43DRAFT_480814 [Delitschia confertaspora ATCC 74209]|uniref:Mediator of RNA polymerase II transcription subunit 11 n=1 Tax=Delitschia confertaspora ATCC 74209 TaxID=1513339 RepID=A0A9P4MVN5_9PLEO|nr:hypothetical protein GQ43DRAFT_480814 [Delitschia confertaspora ATCC 74209]